MRRRRVEQCESCLVGCSALVVVSGGGARIDHWCDARVVALHGVHQRLGSGVPVAHERPQPGVLSVVVCVEEIHHPTDVLADRDALGALGVGRRREHIHGAPEVASQRVVDDSHHPSVCRCVRDSCHDVSFPFGGKSRAIVSASHSS